jgi:hypothetical protein
MKNLFVLYTVIGHLNDLSLDILPQCITDKLSECYTGKFWTNLGWPNKRPPFIAHSHSKLHTLSTV